MSLVFGLLLESVTSNIADFGRARLEARATQLAEQRVRELESEIASGAELESGESEGEFEPPDGDLRWRVTVTEQTLVLPADYPGKASPSPIFAAAGAAPALAPGQAAPLRLVEVRVYAADAEPESALPFVLLVTAPPDPARLEQLMQQSPPGAPALNRAARGAER